MANLKYGSTGDDVKKLQEELQKAGYDIGKTGADGVFGTKTAAAVKEYQRDKGLVVDGIAGTNTMASLNAQKGSALVPGVVAGALTSAGATKPTSKLPTSGSQALQIAATGGVTGANIAAGNTQNNTNKGTKSNLPAVNPGKTETPTTKAPTDQAPTTQAPETGAAKPSTSNPYTYQEFTYDPFTYDPYAKSDTVLQAEALLQEHSNNKPGAYQSQWQSQINDYLNQLENRDPFSYDFNSDALYNQYKDQYIQQGQMAMMDTMGQAAAMTGGYGNSYAQTVGQQAYNQQLNQLNNIMPELYQMAYGRYTDEGQQLKDMYSMYVGLENQDYGRYQDGLNNWYTQLEYLTGRADHLGEVDYNTYLDGRSLAYDNYTTQRETAYDNHTAQENLRWENYIAEEEKRQAAAEIMAGAGDYSLLGNYYGLTDDQVAAIKDANTPKYTPVPAPAGDDVGDGSAYIKPTDEQINSFDKALERGQFDLEYLVNDYAYRYGTDPEYWRNRAGQQQGQNETPTYNGLTEKRQIEIENWVATAISNANGPSFDPNKLIKGSGYFKSDAEREYAYEVVKAMASMR